MRLFVFIAMLVTLSSGSVRAQDSDSRHFSAGAAAGIANPLHGDLGFKAAAWQVDFRFDTARHVASTVFFEEWRHTEEDVRTGVMLLGPSGPIGHVDRLDQRTRYRTRVVGWSLLAKSNGRVAVSGGAGASYLLYARDFSQTLTGCQPASLCTGSSTAFTNSAFAVQAQAGLDLEVVPHLVVMGQYRLVIPVEDPGSGHGTVSGGVRVVF